MLKLLKMHKIQYLVSKVSTFLHSLLKTVVIQICFVFWYLWLFPPFHIIIKSVTGELPPLIVTLLLPRVGPYDFGGVLTNSNRDIINGDALHKRNQAYKEMHW